MQSVRTGSTGNKSKLWGSLEMSNNISSRISIRLIQGIAVEFVQQLLRTSSN
ncbi:MAG TPA: hypothetical protein VJ695_07265 [Nitrososphaera sp.]|nr:hypothetical protein [Nitrososphaera sp.]